MPKTKNKKDEVISKGDWFQDVSEFGGSAKYILVCVDTPCKMGLIEWLNLGPYTSPVQVENVFDITPEEFSRITANKPSHFKRLPRPERIDMPLW